MMMMIYVSLSNGRQWCKIRHSYSKLQMRNDRLIVCKFVPVRLKDGKSHTHTHTRLTALFPGLPG